MLFLSFGTILGIVAGEITFRFIQYKTFMGCYAFLRHLPGKINLVAKKHRRPTEKVDEAFDDLCEYFKYWD